MLGYLTNHPENISVIAQESQKLVIIIIIIVGLFE